MNEHSNIPKIRFKGFNDVWEQRKFDSLARIERGLTYSPTDLNNNGIRVLRSSNIDENYFKLYDEDVFVNPKSINIDFANNNDILITSANGSSRLVGKHAIISGISSNSTVHGGFMLLAKPYINSYFLNASMSSNWYKKFIDLYVAGGNGAIGNLSKADLDNQLVYVPKESEINKIGELFTNLDNLITLHQRKCDNLISVKKSLLEKMFPKNSSNIPELRFKGFNDVWEQRKLADVGNIITGTTPSTSDESNYNGGYLFVSPADINTNRYIEKTNTTLSKKGFESGRILNEGSVLFVSIGSTIGKVAQTKEKSTTNQQINAIEVNGKNNNNFIYSLLEKHSNNIRAGASTQAVPILNKTSFSLLEFNMPKIIEQEKIGQLFRQIDNLITLHQRKLEKLNNIKKSLLDKMFV